MAPLKVAGLVRRKSSAKDVKNDDRISQDQTNFIEFQVFETEPLRLLTYCIIGRRGQENENKKIGRAQERRIKTKERKDFR